MTYPATVKQHLLLQEIAGLRSYIYSQHFHNLRGNPQQREIAEDLTQETLVKAINHASKFRHEAQLRSWLHQIATNTFRDYIRAEQRRKAWYHVSLSQPFSEDGDDALLTLADSLEAPSARQPELEIFLERALKSAPSVYLSVFDLYMQGYRLHEIARILDLRLGTVKSRLYRLQAHLSAQAS